MPSRREFPSPDDQRVENLLRTQLGREVTALFNAWDDPYMAPEIMREHGQAMINRIAELVQQAAESRGLIPR